MYELLKKTHITDSVTEYVFHAPLIAKNGKPGQFVLFRIDELGERVPITLCGTDAEQGTVTLLIQSIGASTTRLSKLNEGDRLLDLVGPLGMATHLDGHNNVMLVAGGIGVAVLYPQAKLLRSQGKKVTCIMGARSKDLLSYVEQMREVCDELIITTDDGSYGIKGFVTVVLQEMLQNSPGVYDLVFAVGPLRMMQAVCNVTKPFGVATVVSMNPIMVDGTGMCGCCRLTVGGEVKYACVDGPEFDGHKVDFEEVINRNRFYDEIEKEHLCRLTGERKNG